MGSSNQMAGGGNQRHQSQHANQNWFSPQAAGHGWLQPMNFLGQSPQQPNSMSQMAQMLAGRRMNPARANYQAARAQAGPNASLNQLMSAGLTNQPYLDQSINQDGQVTRFNAPTSGVMEYLSDTYRQPGAMRQAFAPGNYDPNAALNVTGGQAVNRGVMSSMGYNPDWAGVRQGMSQLMGMPGGSQYNLLGIANAPRDTRNPLQHVMHSLAGTTGRAAPNTPEAMAEAARMRDAAMANVFLGAQSGAISPEEAHFLNNMTGRSAQFSNASDPAIQPGNPFQYVMGNPGQAVNVTAGRNAAVTAQGASGAPGMAGANAAPSAAGLATPLPGTPEYQNWQYGYGNKPPVQQPTPQSAPASDPIADAARYMAANPGQFGFDPNKSAEENYQAAHYIQSHPEQFNMVQGPDSTWQMSSIADAARFMAENPGQFQGLDTGGLSPEQLYQRAFAIQSNPGQFNSVQGPDGIWRITQR